MCRWFFGPSFPLFLLYLHLLSLCAAWNIELINESMVCWALTTGCKPFKSRTISGRDKHYSWGHFDDVPCDLIACLVWLVITMLVRHKQWATLWTQPHLAFDIRTTVRDIWHTLVLVFNYFISLSIGNILLLNIIIGMPKTFCGGKNDMSSCNVVFKANLRHL